MLIHFSFSQTHEPFIFLSLKIRTLVTEIWLEFKDVFNFDISEADLCRLVQPKNHKTSNISSGKQKVDTSIFWKRNPKEMKFTKPQTVSWYFVRRGLVQNFCLEFRIQTAWFLKTTKNAQKICQYLYENEKNFRISEIHLFHFCIVCCYNLNWMRGEVVR